MSDDKRNRETAKKISTFGYTVDELLEWLPHGLREEMDEEGKMPFSITIDLRDLPENRELIHDNVLSRHFFYL